MTQNSFFKKILCVYFGKKLIDVKISAWLPVYLTTLNLVASPRKILHSDFCLYILEGLFFFFKEKNTRIA